MTEHEQYAEDLALYAVDALRGEERAKLDQHLSTCAACRLELEQACPRPSFHRHQYGLHIDLYDNSKSVQTATICGLHRPEV